MKGHFKRLMITGGILAAIAILATFFNIWADYCLERNNFWLFISPLVLLFAFLTWKMVGFNMNTTKPSE